MDISSEIFSTDGSNSSDFNRTEVEAGFEMSSLVDINAILLSFPINSYVIWLILRGSGNGLAAEFFGLSLAVCEIFICIDSFLSLLVYICKNLSTAVDFLDGLAVTGRPLFQCLMCVERYLAVVHPVTFLKYKPLRYRVICSVIVWVAGFLSSGINIMTLLSNLYFFFFFTQFFLFLSFQLFCCLAVLRALKQSGPGERGREREEQNHAKRKAFYLILITNVTLIILYVPYMIFAFPQWISANSTILLSISYIFFTLTSLVQPLLFLYRVGKLPFINSQ